MDVQWLVRASPEVFGVHCYARLLVFAGEARSRGCGDGQGRGGHGGGGAWREGGMGRGPVPAACEVMPWRLGASGEASLCWSRFEE